MRAPDVTLGIASGREGPGAARERLTTFSVSVPLPLFRRNAGGIGAAMTEAEQATVERESAERDVPTQVRALWLRLQSLRERVQRFERTVLPTLARNEELSTKSRQAGQIGLLEMLIANPRRVLTRSRILEEVWGYDFPTSGNALEVYIGYLRRKTEAEGEPRLIHTVRGVGYVLRETPP